MNENKIKVIYCSGIFEGGDRPPINFFLCIGICSIFLRQYYKKVFFFLLQAYTNHQNSDGAPCLYNFYNISFHSSYARFGTLLDFVD